MSQRLNDDDGGNLEQSFRTVVARSQEHEVIQLGQQLSTPESRDAEIHTWREKYAHRIFCVIVVWLFCDVGLVLLYGFGQAKWILFLAKDTVIIAFITSTTVAVLGLFAIVMRWLYPSSDSKQPLPKDPFLEADEEV